LITIRISLGIRRHRIQCCYLCHHFNDATNLATNICFLFQSKCHKIRCRHFCFM